MTQIIRKKIQIEGMHCTSCAMNIDFDLEDVPGIVSSKTSYAKQETVVEFDQESIPVESILLHIKKTGYTGQVKND